MACGLVSGSRCRAAGRARRPRGRVPALPSNPAKIISREGRMNGWKTVRLRLRRPLPRAAAQGVVMHGDDTHAAPAHLTTHTLQARSPTQRHTYICLSSLPAIAVLLPPLGAAYYHTSARRMVMRQAAFGAPSKSQRKAGRGGNVVGSRQATRVVVVCSSEPQHQQRQQQREDSVSRRQALLSVGAGA